ncbi:hypothetical protein, conserved [Plasmodium gonderi]|uniref:Uncharacterized protein n=1 Tax=Plasmodium gonderi TaxID=77519 RepID=A0A1Y1JV06_PLAGO|nr:hypothetical protein, conserved [Plasmodium gonderi]GAW83744.1 hypothetical protein, conserved [Plasmodium gonderi]
MPLKKARLFLICDKEGFVWIPVLRNEWEIKYLFCDDEKLKKCYVDTFGLHETETNTHDNVLKFIENQNFENVDLLFLAISTTKLHELILEYVINKKKFYYIFSSNIPTLNIQKLEKLKRLINNFNMNTNIVYDVKEEFKHINRQFYWNIFNPLINERVFYSLKNILNELGGHIHAVQIESTFIPFLTENEGVENALFYRTVLIISLIEFLFGKPKSVSAKCYSLKSENVTIKSIVGSALFASLNCHFNISVNSCNKIFDFKVYGDDGFVDVSYNTEHNCFQLVRCLNHYEYPSLFVEGSHESALNELKYFIDEKLYTNKYINVYNSAVHTALGLWRSNGENVSLENKESDECDNLKAKIKIEAVKDCITA